MKAVGVFFADLGPSYTCKVMRRATNIRKLEQSGEVESVEQALAEPKMITKTLSFPDLKTSIATPWKELMNRRFGTPSLYFGVQILHRFKRSLDARWILRNRRTGKLMLYCKRRCNGAGRSRCRAFISETVLTCCGKRTELN